MKKVFIGSVLLAGAAGVWWKFEDNTNFAQGISTDRARAPVNIKAMENISAANEFVKLTDRPLKEWQAESIKNSSPAVLPPADAPLEAVVNKLRQDADSGNPFAACRISVELLRCKLLPLGINNFEELNRQYESIDLRSPTATDLKNSIDLARKSLQVEKRVCAGFINSENLVPWKYLLQAALQGHTRSQELFVFSPPINPNEMFTSGEFFESYRSYAPTFLIEAANAGHEQAVSGTAWAYLGPTDLSVFNPGFGNQLVKPDAYKAAVYAYASFSFPIAPTSSGREASRAALKVKVDAQLAPEDIIRAKAEAATLVWKWQSTLDELSREKRKDLSSIYLSPSSFCDE